MLKSQSPLSGNQFPLPKSGRKPLQPKNSPATPILTPLRLKPTKRNASEWIEISSFNSISNTENLCVYSPDAAPAKIEHFDSSLAEELSALREKRERLKMDKEKTEKILEKRELYLDVQMRELKNRGEVQKMHEIEVDRLYRLNQLKLSCMSISPIRSLREKEIGKGKGKGMKTRDEVEEEGSQ